MFQENKRGRGVVEYLAICSVVGRAQTHSMKTIRNFGNIKTQEREKSDYLERPKQLARFHRHTRGNQSFRRLGHKTRDCTGNTPPYGSSARIVP